MSLTKAKASLFDASQPATTKSNVSKEAQEEVGGASASARLARKPNGASRLSPEMRAIKVTEAEDCVSKGNEYLKTSIFQWNPDHMGAAGYFEKASNAYKALGDVDRAYEMIIQTGKCHEGYGSLQSAANSLMSAAKLTLSMPNTKGIQAYIDAADLWGQCGDIDRTAECYALAAAQSEETDVPKAIELHQRACDLVCPKESSLEEMKRCNIKSMEILRGYFNFLIKDESRYPVAIEHAKHLGKFYKAWEIETSMCKIFCAITILQLLMKDVASADETHLQEHLNESIYLTSKESEIAENLLTAFKTADTELLMSSTTGQNMFFLDQEVQFIIKRLNLSGIKAPETVLPPIISELVTGNADENEDSDEDLL